MVYRVYMSLVLVACSCRETTKLPKLFPLLFSDVRLRPASMYMEVSENRDPNIAP